jgi:hypothetical protein
MLLRIIGIAALWCVSCRAQPAFDVASVRPLPADARGWGGMEHTVTPTSLTMPHVSLGYMVR